MKHIAISRAGVVERSLTAEEVTQKESQEAALAAARAAAQRIAAIAATDKDMARVGEDLLDILIVKGVVSLDDFPAQAREKINNRKALRNG